MLTVVSNNTILCIRDKAQLLNESSGGERTRHPSMQQQQRDNETTTKEQRRNNEVVLFLTNYAVGLYSGICALQARMRRSA